MLTLSHLISSNPFPSIDITEGIPKQGSSHRPLLTFHTDLDYVSFCIILSQLRKIPFTSHVMDPCETRVIGTFGDLLEEAKRPE